MLQAEKNFLLLRTKAARRVERTCQKEYTAGNFIADKGGSSVSTPPR
jgi:hypothetical protein